MKLKPFICALGLLLVFGSSAYAQHNLIRVTGKAIIKGEMETVPTTITRTGRTIKKGATVAKAGEYIFPGLKAKNELETTNPGLANRIREGVEKMQARREARKLSHILSPEDLKALNEMVIIVADQKGVSLQHPGDPREILLSDIPSLPNGVKAENMALVFGANEGEAYIQKLMGPYLAQYPVHGDAMSQIVMGAYEGALEDPDLWNIRRITTHYTEKFRAEDPEFPQDLTLETLVQESPAFFPSLAVLSLREYVIQHGFSFPAYGFNAPVVEEPLNSTIHVVWRRLIAGELTPEANDMLVSTYLYSLNARDLGSIVTETENFINANGRFPGSGWLTLTPTEAYDYLQSHQMNQMPTEVINEITLGMQSYIVTKAVPHSPEVWNTLPTALKMRINHLNLSMAAH